MRKSDYLTSAEAAESLGFSQDHVRKLIYQGKIKAEKFGRNWVVEKKDLYKIRRQRFPREKEISTNGNNKR